MSSQPPEVRIARLLKAHGLTLVTAESCTGGLIGHLLTSVPGSSTYYLGGAVSYSDALKMNVLGVREQTLVSHGAVSEQAAAEMASGARVRFGGDIGLSVTGIAGPGGGSETKPVGLTYIGLSSAWVRKVERRVWKSDRDGNKRLSAEAALELVIGELERI